MIYVVNSGVKIQIFCISTKYFSEKVDLFEQILTKEEINKRFKRAVTAILSQKLISSKAGLADSLKVKPAKFSEILNDRMNAGVDMIAIMCDYYHVSPDWILMGRGNNVFRHSELPKYWIDDDDLDIEYHGHGESINSVSQPDKVSVAPFMDLIHEKDNVIREQAEEIGRLKARIEELERRKGDYASDAATEIAHAG